MVQGGLHVAGLDAQILLRLRRVSNAARACVRACVSCVERIATCRGANVHWEGA